MSRLNECKQFKDEFNVGKYSKILPKQSSSIMAKLHNGTFPVRMETGSYLNLKPEQTLPFLSSYREHTALFNGM